VAIQSRQRTEQGDSGMQKVRLYTLAGSVRPADNNSASSLCVQEGYVFPASYPMLPATHITYASETRIPLLSANLNNIQGVSSPSPSILAVDDSLTIRKIVETVLRREGYVTITFPDGVAAFRWLAEVSCPPPKIVLLDIELPKMDGYAIARALKAKPTLESTTIIMMSRRDGIIDRLKGRLAGAEDHLPKPFKAEELVEIVHRYLGNTTDALVGR
jgi:twitching motility two-component system response regulator PilG